MLHSKDLKRWQLERMLRTVSPALRYVAQVAERAEQEFPPEDTMRQKAIDARDKLMSLQMELNSLSCQAGLPKDPTVLRKESG